MILTKILRLAHRPQKRLNLLRKHQKAQKICTFSAPEGGPNSSYSGNQNQPLYFRVNDLTIPNIYRTEDGISRSEIGSLATKADQIFQKVSCILNPNKLHLFLLRLEPQQLLYALAINYSIFSECS